MLSLLFLSCLPLLVTVHGKTQNNDALIHVILREQASMIKHCMSNVCTRNMYNPNRPVRRIVAFSVSPRTTLQNIASNTRIVFGHIRKNIGNAYNPITGIFTAPLHGVYAFHWTIMVTARKYSGIYIQVNGRNKVLLYGNAGGYPNWYSPSQSYVTDLRKGDTVNLINTSAGGYIHPFSTFTGYRL